MDLVRRNTSIGASFARSLPFVPPLAPATQRSRSLSPPHSREITPPPALSTSKTEPTEIVVPPELRGKVVDLLPEDGTPEFNPSSYEVVPDIHVISVHGTHNLLALGIVINTLLKCVICVECKEGVELQTICVHARKHNPHHTATDSLVEELTQEYGLVTMEQIPYPDLPILPVFGLHIHPELLYFCGACHRGFASTLSLQSHQSSMARCGVSRAERTSYRSYGQRLTNGKHRRFFPVDISLLERHSAAAVPDYSEIFTRTLPPPADYSKIPIRGVEDQQNLGSFLFREGWLEAVQGYTATEINEATRLPTKEDDAWGKALQAAAHRAMAKVQPLISRHHGFGLSEAIAQFYLV